MASSYGCGCAGVLFAGALFAGVPAVGCKLSEGPDVEVDVAGFAAGTATFGGLLNEPLTGAPAGVVGNIGVALDCRESSSTNPRDELSCRCAFNIANTTASPRKMPAVYFVILVSAFPEPAPISVSTAPAPNASPAPASFFGNCTSTSRIKNRQITTRMNVKNPINRLID
jgi:hypothetical protein